MNHWDDALSMDRTCYDTPHSADGCIKRLVVTNSLCNGSICPKRIDACVVFALLGFLIFVALALCLLIKRAVLAFYLLC